MCYFDDLRWEEYAKVSAETAVGLVKPDHIELFVWSDKQEVDLLVFVHSVNAVLIVADLLLGRFEFIEDVGLGER